MSVSEKACRRQWSKQVRAYWNGVIRDVIASLQRPNLPHLPVPRGIMSADEFHPRASSLM